MLPSTNHVGEVARPALSPASPLFGLGRVFATVGVVLAAVVAAGVLWYGREVFLLAFAGVLLAVFFDGLAAMVSRRTGIGRSWSLAVAVGGLVALVVAVGYLLAPGFAAQTERLVEELPQAAERFAGRLREYPWGRNLVENMPPPESLYAPRSGISGQVFGVFSTTLDVVGGLVVVLCSGLFLALEPRVYVNGVLRLLPVPARRRGAEVMAEVGCALWGWITGQGVSMLFVGVTTGVGLYLLGVPFALPLALLSAVLGFVPYAGPILAVVPAALLAFLEGPWLAASVVGLYAGVQAVEGNFVTPFVQRRAADIPPVLTLLALLLAGVLLGPLGLLLAVPLTAAAIVLVRRLYVEDFLGDRAGSDSPDPDRT